MRGQRLAARLGGNTKKTMTLNTSPFEASKLKVKFLGETKGEKERETLKAGGTRARDI